MKEEEAFSRKRTMHKRKPLSFFVEVEKWGGMGNRLLQGVGEKKKCRAYSSAARAGVALLPRLEKIDEKIPPLKKQRGERRKHQHGLSARTRVSR